MESPSQSIQKARRQGIVNLQRAIEAHPGVITPEEAEKKFNDHYFAPGMYGRGLFIPEGVCVVGKTHLHSHLNVLTYGHVKVVSEFGEEEIAGPRIWVSEPGIKRAIIALEDSEWLTVHANPSDHTDLALLEREIIAPEGDTS